MTSWRLILAIISITIITVAGDYFIKLASMASRPVQNKWFVAGCIMYVLSTFGWVYALRHIKLASIGVIYSLSIVVLLAALGVFVFGETLNRYEIAGLVFAVIAIVLLGRFGG
jgi:drug/metabolite transporter (DMT)-like permease